MEASSRVQGISLAAPANRKMYSPLNWALRRPPRNRWGNSQTKMSPNQPNTSKSTTAEKWPGYILGLWALIKTASRSKPTIWVSKTVYKTMITGVITPSTPEEAHYLWLITGQNMSKVISDWAILIGRNDSPTRHQEVTGTAVCSDTLKRTLPGISHKLIFLRFWRTSIKTSR